MARRPAPPVDTSVPSMSNKSTAFMPAFMPAFMLVFPAFCLAHSQLHTLACPSMTYLFETEEHAQLRRNVKRFAQTYIAPHAHAWEEANEFPRELYKTAAEAGLLGISYPTEDGGGGGDMTHALVAAEEMVLF